MWTGRALVLHRRLCPANKFRFRKGLQKIMPSIFQCLPRIQKCDIFYIMAEGSKKIAENKKARFNYFVEDSIECGVALEGTEVKSVKNGNISFSDSFAEIINGEIWLKNFHISEYAFSSVFNHNPDRSKKLLLHREQIKRLIRKTEEKGYTLIPLEIYLKNGRVKIALGVCKGKKLFDKRETIKSRDIERDVARDFKKSLS